MVENDYKGLLFPSTKNYNDLVDFHIYSNHEINTAFFVKYNENDEHDINLSNSFHSFLLDGSEKYDYQICDILKIFDEAFDKNKNSSVNNNDFILPLVETKLYMEYMAPAKLNGTSYFETHEGKMELEYFSKLGKKMYTLIRP